MESAYFLTVDWCKDGRRGVFCDSTGCGYRKDDAPHTELEMHEILGPFWLILAPESELLTEQQVSEFTLWTPLAEYSNQFGIARKADSSAT
jgi:hypothetical protein